MRYYTKQGNRMTIEGIIRKKNRLFTVNLPSCKGKTVYGERLKQGDGKELRSWNPYRSKLAAAIIKGCDISTLLSTESSILYLGAATGTTVSHLSDIAYDGMIYAVEHSPIAAKKLIDLAKQRKNIIPLYHDANHPERYSRFVPTVDFVYQDISQRNQADIFIRNIQQYLKQDNPAMIMIKARSIDVSLPPKKAYEQVEKELKNKSLHIDQKIVLSPFEKDHIVFTVSQKKPSGSTDD